MHVAGEPAQHVAVAAAVERVGLEQLQVAQEPLAEVEREALPYPGGGVLVAERQQRPEQGEADHHRDVDRERAERLGDQHVVDDQLEQPDLGRLDGRKQRREHDPGDERPAIPAGQRPEAAHDLADRDRGRCRDDAVVVGSRSQ
jgi:hypothetical protein